jgi:WD40 repeat protein
VTRTLPLGVACAALLGCSQPATPPAPALAPEPLSPGCLARFGDARLRLSAPVKSLALSPDGKVLAATTPAEPVVRFWDTTTATPLRELRIDVEFAESVTVIGFAPDGRRLLVIRHQSRQARSPSHKWHEPATVDTQTGAVTRWLWGAETDHYLPTFTVSPDGRTVAGVTQYAELKVWELDTGREARTLGKLEGTSIRSLCGVCYSPDGTHVAACADHRAVYVAPTDGSRPLRKLPVDHRRGASSVAWPSPDRLVALWSDGLAAYDPATGRQLARADLGGNMISNPRAAAGGTLFVRPDTDRDVAAIDLTTLARVPDREFRGSRRDEPFAVSADGKTLALACGHAVRLFNTATGKSLHPELDRHPMEPADRFQLSADGRRLLSAGGRSAQTWDLPDGRLRADFERRTDFQAPNWSLSPDGRRVAGWADGRPVIHDAATGTQVAGRDWEGGTVGLAGNDRVWVREYPTGDFVAVVITTGKRERRLAAFPATTFAAASPDGRKLAASGALALALRTDDPAGRWVEVESNRERQTPKCGLSPPDCAIPVRFSPDGRRLLTWDHGHVLWDVSKSPALVGRLSQGSAREWWWGDASFSPDGRRVAAAFRGEDGKSSVRVWEAASAAELARLDVPGGASGCAFTPDGRRLVVAHPDTTFSVWDYAALEAKALAPKTADAWADLASPDPKVGLAAVRDLAADPDAVRLLREKFTAPDPARLAKLVAELDAPAFAAREAASKELAALGEAAEAALRAAAKGSPSAEVRQRAEALIRRLYPTDGGRSGARLRAVRAVEVLERVGSPEAAALVREWAADERLPARAAEAAAARRTP